MVAGGLMRGQLKTPPSPIQKCSKVEACQPKLEDRAQVVTCRGRGSRVMNAPPQPLLHMTIQSICFTCKKCGKLLVVLEVLTLHLTRGARTRRGGNKASVVRPQEVLLFPAMKPDDNKTAAPAEGTCVWRDRCFPVSKKATRFCVFSSISVNNSCDSSTCVICTPSLKQ